MKYKTIVIVGNLKKNFSRLIDKVFEIQDDLPKNILIQHGHTEIKLNNHKDIQFYKFLDNQVLINLMREADVIISHCGAGVLLESLILKKKLYVLPREKKYHEHIDNHQVELFEYFNKKKYLCHINEFSLFSDAKNINEINLINKKLNNFLENIINEI